MKQRLAIAAAAALFAAVTTDSRATTYTDTAGDVFFAPSNPHMDITSVEVTNNFADVIFKINLLGDPVAVDWGKYCIGIDTNPATGDTSANGNGWGRAISMTPNGMDYWVGTWVDGAMGANLSHFDGAFWNAQGGSTVSKTTSNVTITIPIAGLGKTYGDSFDFDVYTTGGGGGDPAIDSLANTAQTVSDWATPYASSLVKTYTISVPPIPPTNHVKFMVDMQIPIYEYDNSIGNGFNTNTDQVFVRGSFNGWGAVSAGYQLIQVGPTLFSNTVEVIQYLNQSVDYKFEGVSFPGYEAPVTLCGGNRTLLITNFNESAPLAYFSDRKLSDPNVDITFKVDMSLARNFGQFDPTLHGVSMPGSFNGWNTGVLPLSQGADPNTNIYSTTISYQHYPTNACNFGFYKFFISGNGAARDGGWEDPIGTGGGNRAFSISSAAQTNSYYYNDEDPKFKVLSVQKLDADNAKVTWQSFPSRGANIPTGGVYQVESRASLTSPWVILGTNYSTASLTSATNSGLTGVNQQYYRVSLIGLVPAP